MNPAPDIVYPNPVVSFDDYGNLVLKMHDPGTHRGKPERSRQLQAKMLILNMPVQVPCRRFENMGCRHAARGNPPATAFKQECGFWLRAGKTELAGIPWNTPGRVVGSQRPKSLGNGCFVQPFDLGRRLAEDRVQAFRLDKLDGASAVLAEIGNQPEGAPGRDMEPLPPLVKHVAVVRQEAPKIRIDLRVSMLG